VISNPMDTIPRKRLGEILVESGRITEAQLKEAMACQTPRKRLGTVLQEMGLVSEQEVVDTLSAQLGIPSLSLETFLIDPDVVELIPESLARRHSAIALFLVGDELTVAMSDPSDIVAQDELRRASGRRIQCVVAPPSAINRALDDYYSLGHSLQDVIRSFEGEAQGGPEEAMPVVRLVNRILFQAVKLGASDIHFEPREKDYRVRFRIDGVLQEILRPPVHLSAAITSRLKILASLDISEKRLPQDGRFSLTVGHRDIDLRLSSLPTAFGEKVVLRILYKSSLLMGVDQLGLSPQEKGDFHYLLGVPYGLVLVTGPTGSGKTTTLYAMLQYLNSTDRNIVTVEDPVEYQFNDINQMQVNPRVDLTFSRGLRAILRQDPDIIMVGEIRDDETAMIAIRAALTGHLVLSTVHTNDAVNSVGRLIDMGVKPYLLASSLVGVIAQRLVRRVCEECVRYKTPDSDVLKRWEIEPMLIEKWAEPKGCKACNRTGYKGRRAIFEILRVDESIREMILQSESSVAIRKAARSKGLSSLRASGIRLVSQGITTMEEVARVTAFVEGE